MDNEIWMPVIGYEGLYEASSEGRIRSLPRMARANYGIRTYGGKILDPIVRKKDAYLVVSLHKHRKMKQRSVHSLVLEAFLGLAPDGMEGCHGNGVKGDCRLDNLRWGTRLENAKDKQDHGTIVKGEQSPNAKLKEPQVIEIRAMQGTNASIAKIYGVTDVLIGKIKRRESWTHIL